MFMSLLWLFFLAACLSWGLTALLRRYALGKNLMDVPNTRSSHSIPTPRGGGLSIVITFILGLLYLWHISLVSDEVVIGLCGAGAAVAILGFIDDHGHIAARWRLLGHCFIAIWLVFWLGPVSEMVIFGIQVDMGWIGYALVVPALVWLLNLYNFMDGIDGIAGIEALATTLIVAIIFLVAFEERDMFAVNLLMFSAVAGFVAWNFPPAKIFMGDVGSGFLGLMLGALALYSASIETVMLWIWLILLGVFIVDSTYTLIHRLIRGERVYEAHRSHAYQFASRKYGSHLVVTSAVLAINLCWLTPWAFLVSLGLIDGALGLMAAYFPLVWLAWHFKAGAGEQVVV